MSYDYIKTLIRREIKRPMGRFAHLRNQFKSINTYDYIISWITCKRRGTHYFLCENWMPITQGCFFNVFSRFCYYLPLEKGMTLHLNKFVPPSSKDALCQVWLNFAQWFWRRRFLNFVNVFSLFRNYLPLEKGGALHLNKLESLSPKDALCQVWLKLAQ